MPTAPPFAAILVAAGRSRRMGTDKLWTDFWGRPTWRWSLDALLASRGLERVAIAVSPDASEDFRAALPPSAVDRCLIVPGGDARADSVIAGLWALTGVGHADDTLVLVHDAARPAVSVELIESVAAAARAGGWAVVPVVPVIDSLKRVRGGRVIAAVEREEVAAVQTPRPPASATCGRRSRRPTRGAARSPTTPAPLPPPASRCTPSTAIRPTGS